MDAMDSMLPPMPQLGRLPPLVSGESASCGPAHVPPSRAIISTGDLHLRLGNPRREGGGAGGAGAGLTLGVPRGTLALIRIGPLLRSDARYAFSGIACTVRAHCLIYTQVGLMPYVLAGIWA